MKKFNFLIILTIIMYFVFALLISYVVLSLEENINNGYRVEINRILNELKYKENIDLSEYYFVKDISYLNILENNQEEINTFFEEQNHQKNSIKPFYKDGILKSYVKFNYTESKYSIFVILILFEIMLFTIFIFVILLLLNLKYNIIKPFYRFSNLSEVLSKGHYKDEIKVEKSKYFSKYLLGMSQLKDELDLSKKKQLELLKEKKQLLLSLSHDIKTPLNLIRLYKKSLEENIYSKKEEEMYVLKQIDEKVIEIEKYVDEITTSFREDILDLPVVITEVYLKDILDKIFKNYKEKCKIRQINFIVSEYDNRLVKCDMDRIQEVIENIFENAIKYGDGKEINVTFSEEDYCCLIHIYNSGTPVLEHELFHLFDSFFRGINSKGKQGSGLGLYISKQLMRKMDGDIYAQIKENGMEYVIVIR